MNKQTVLNPAQIKWQDTTPVSVSFDDFYFSTDDGINESRYVFLKPNNIPACFQSKDIKQTCIIAETGFGTGLNFLLTWQAWREVASPKRPLHFFSIEKYPLTKEDLSRSLSHWPELKELSQLLINQYPPLVSGLQCLEFEAGNVRLHLFFGDVSTDLSKMSFKADAWYLDGFAPKKNPDMWTADFFKLIREKSNPEATFSTFTSASIVRKTLIENGFTVSKQEGFGKKREMLFGSYNIDHQNSNSKNQEHTQKTSWSLPSSQEYSASQNHELDTEYYDVAVIGAGIAGLTTAYELAKSGLKVCVVEQNQAPVSGASGQSQLAMYAKLPSEANKLFKFIIQALSSSIRFYNTLQSETVFNEQDMFWNQTGLMQLAWNEKESKKIDKFFENIQLPKDLIQFIDARNATEKSGLDIKVGALWFEKAGWLDPKKYAETLLKNYSIKIIYDYKINSLSFCEERKVWALNSSDKASIHARYTVIANSNDAKHIPQLSHLPIKPLRGQVSSASHPLLKPSKVVICGEGYLCPAVNNWHHFGATFDLKCHEPIIKQSDLEQNINSLRNWLPEWMPDSAVENAHYEHSAGLRCTTPDYLPIVGRAPMYEIMLDDFAKLRVDSNACKHQYGTYYPNLFVNVGHGSKGLFTTPLAAHIIRHQICGGLPPCIEEHRVMLSPARFIIKHLTQRRI